MGNLCYLLLHIVIKDLSSDYKGGKKFTPVHAGEQQENWLLNKGNFLARYGDL